MKIKKIELDNFRAYASANADNYILLDDFNCIIGKNDVGKSTIFAALDLVLHQDNNVTEYDYNVKEKPILITLSIEDVNQNYSSFVKDGVITLRQEFSMNLQKNVSTFEYKILDNSIFIPISSLPSFSLTELLPSLKVFKADTPLAELQNLYIRQKCLIETRNLSKAISNLNFAEISGLKFKGATISFSCKEMVTSMDGKDIPLSNRGDGILVNAKNLMFRNLAGFIVNEDYVLAFEEPETHLHPSAHIEMYNTLKKLSDNNHYQVLMTTHSPFIVKELAQDGKNNVIIVKQNDPTKSAEIINQKKERVIKNYVSMNEINYIAFDLPSVEYHIELFGYIHSKLIELFESDNAFQNEWKKLKKYDKDGNLVDVGSIKDVAAVDAWLVNANNIHIFNQLHIDCDNVWYKEDKSKNCFIKELKRSLPHCVRNYIDHPLKERERIASNDNYNTAFDNNKQYADIKKIKLSINIMRNVILSNPQTFN